MKIICSKEEFEQAVAKCTDIRQYSGCSSCALYHVCKEFEKQEELQGMERPQRFGTLFEVRNEGSLENEEVIF